MLIRHCVYQILNFIYIFIYSFFLQILFLLYSSQTHGLNLFLLSLGHIVTKFSSLSLSLPHTIPLSLTLVRLPSPSITHFLSLIPHSDSSLPPPFSLTSPPDISLVSHASGVFPSYYVHQFPSSTLLHFLIHASTNFPQSSLSHSLPFLPPACLTDLPPPSSCLTAFPFPSLPFPLSFVSRCHGEGYGVRQRVSGERVVRDVR